MAQQEDIDNPFRGYYSSARAAQIIAENNGSKPQPNNIPKWVKAGRLHPHVYSEELRKMVPIVEPQQRISYYFPADEVENFKLEKRGPKPKETAKDPNFKQWYDKNKETINARRKEQRQARKREESNGTR